MDTERNSPFGIYDGAVLFAEFEKFCKEFIDPFFLDVEISRQRVHDVFDMWEEDLARNRDRSFRGVKKGTIAVHPDHIKAASYLTYWLRRVSPIVNFLTPCASHGMYSPDSQLEIEIGISFIGTPEFRMEETLTDLRQKELSEIKTANNMSLDKIIDMRSIIFSSGNEFLSFMFGFNLARAYEEQKIKEINNECVNISMPTLHYIRELCYIFRFKSISPHAVYLIFRALLHKSLI